METTQPAEPKATLTDGIDQLGVSGGLGILAVEEALFAADRALQGRAAGQGAREAGALGPDRIDGGVFELVLGLQARR